LAKRTTTTRKKKKATGQKMSYELIGVLFLFSSALGIGQLGFAGIALANFFRFFVGETYPVSLALFGAYGLYLILRGKEPKIRRNWLISGILLYSAALLYLHSQAFETVVTEGASVVSVTLARFLTDVRQADTASEMGGGLIGAALYTGTHFLVSQWGTYIIIGLLVFFGTAVIFGFTTHDVMEVVRKVALTFGHNSKRAVLYTKDKVASSIIDSKTVKRSTRSNSVPTDKKPSIVEKAKNQIKSESAAKKLMKEEAEALKASEKDTLAEKEREPVQLKIDSFQKQLEKSAEHKYADIEKSASAQPASLAKTPAGSSEEDNSSELEFEITAEQENRDYQLPPVTLLNEIKAIDQSNEYATIEKNVKKLEETFASFGVEAKVTKANLGPAVTKYEIQPAVGVKVSKIVSLSDDLALALAAKDIRIEAPIPGKSFIGIEVPNREVSVVSFRDVMEGQKHTDKLLEVPLGRDISGVVQSANLTKMPHLLIAGATGSGKSVCINGIITSILMKAKPNEVKMMMIDPKMVELNVYNGIPHLLTPVVTNPRKAAQALQKVVTEMERRYELFAGTGMRNIDGYNNLIVEYNLENGENNPTLPYIVVIVDELADLMMVASNEVEDAITRLAQMARAAGIHMILATQRPSVDVITGIIKANVPSRIAFAVSSSIDSRTIIDGSGAEKLLGRGDMLFRPMGENKPIRVQGAFISDEEVEHIVTFVKNQQEANYVEEMMPTEAVAAASEEPEDDLFGEAVEFIRSDETASISKLQRRFRIGYNRAARLIDEMEARGIVGPADGSKPRKVNISEGIYENDTDIHFDSEV
jgi:S-DNA-T family DNA segregation ATPase FtsK/SpoIIIE